MLTLNDYGDDESQAFSFHFDAGEYSGSQFTAGFQICPNPVCMCEAISLDVSTGRSTSDATLPITLNITEHTTNHDQQAGEAGKLAAALVRHMNENDWHLLEDLYFATKTRLTETTAVEEIDAFFPPDVLEDQSAMVGLLEVLPYAELITIELDGVEYRLDELHCVNPQCNCQTAGIVFWPNDSSPAIPDNLPLVFVSYKTGRWSLSELGNYEESLVKRLADKAIKDGCCKTLQARHEKMRLLFKIYKKKHHLQNLHHNIMKTVGRNDPCPCGSGKKYKRCCLT